MSFPGSGPGSAPGGGAPSPGGGAPSPGGGAPSPGGVACGAGAPDGAPGLACGYGLAGWPIGGWPGRTARRGDFDTGEKPLDDADENAPGLGSSDAPWAGSAPLTRLCLSSSVASVDSMRESGEGISASTTKHKILHRTKKLHEKFASARPAR